MKLLLLFSLLLTSCQLASVRSVQGPDGSMNKLISCSSSVEDCYAKAHEICGKYQIINSTSNTSSTGIENPQTSTTMQILVKCVGPAPTGQAVNASGHGCMNGNVRHGFVTPTTSGDAPCAQGTQTCVLGEWRGPTLFQTCESFTKSCDGQPHGSVVSGFLQPTSPHGVPCMTAVKTCINGMWNGPEVYPSCSEQ